MRNCKYAETFICLYCLNVRSEDAQPALLWSPALERWRCCIYCAASNSDLCNCCGVEVQGYAEGSPIHICAACRAGIGWDGGPS
jgi:hypothetical protein